MREASAKAVAKTVQTHNSEYNFDENTQKRHLKKLTKTKQKTNSSPMTTVSKGRILIIILYIIFALLSLLDRRPAAGGLVLHKGGFFRDVSICFPRCSSLVSHRLSKADAYSKGLSSGCGGRGGHPPLILGPRL